MNALPCKLTLRAGSGGGGGGGGVAEVFAENYVRNELSAFEKKTTEKSFIIVRLQNF